MIWDGQLAILWNKQINFALYMLWLGNICVTTASFKNNMLKIFEHYCIPQIFQYVIILVCLFFVHHPTFKLFVKIKLSCSMITTFYDHNTSMNVNITVLSFNLHKQIILDNYTVITVLTYCVSMDRQSRIRLL